MRILVTGGRGFIGSAVVRALISTTSHDVVNVDRLTYASTEGSVAAVADNPRYSFEQADICEEPRMAAIFEQYRPDAVMNLAAESHVDRSIDGPGEFVRTNVLGTYVLLEAARTAGVKRFHHISTDEVFGSLSMTGSAFTEASPYEPRSPYSASKAGSDHLVRAWGETYGFPVLVTNCANNYGPFHFPEKLIPLVTIRAMREEALPVYGKGNHVRDWLHVDDHAQALIAVLERGQPGETYNIGANEERTSLQIVEAVCDLVDELSPRSNVGSSRRDLIEFVADRPGHDLRYAVDASKITAELGWAPTRTFAQGLRQTIQWYLDNEWWWGPLVGATNRRGLGGD